MPTTNSGVGVGSGENRFSYERSVRRILWITLCLNLLVVLGKLIAGYAAGSLSVIGDALHSSADSLNNVVGLFIIRIAGADPDEDHPYGHQKFETLAAFGIAGFLLITAFEVAVSAVKRLMGSTNADIEITTLTFGVLIGTLCVNAFVWFYERRGAIRLNSSFLLADSKHTLSDIYVTSSIILGLITVRMGFLFMDAVLALAVAGFIAFAAYQIFSSTIPVLVDSAPLSSEYIARIARSVPGVQSVHEIRSRGVPGKIFITMHLVVSPRETTAAHAVMEEVSQKLETAIGPCQVNIQIEPEHAHPA